jgi:hypothetical protein
MTVSTFESAPLGVLPKKSLAQAISSSNPPAFPSLPNENPTLSFFCSQPVRFLQNESPP